MMPQDHMDLMSEADLDVDLEHGLDQGMAMFCGS